MAYTLLLSFIRTWKNDTEQPQYCSLSFIDIRPTHVEKELGEMFVEVSWARNEIRSWDLHHCDQHEWSIPMMTTLL